MSNFLQDALRALDDEELERFIRWLNIEKELELLTSGGELKDLMSRDLQPDNAYMHADTAAGPAFFRASLQAILNCMIVLTGIDAICIAIVKAEY